MAADFITEGGKVIRKEIHRNFKFYVESMGLSEISNRENNRFKTNQTQALKTCYAVLETCCKSTRKVFRQCLYFHSLLPVSSQGTWTLEVVQFLNFP